MTQRGEDGGGQSLWFPGFHQKRPLLHIACERGAWNCVQYLLGERAEEINQCYDEYYPIHQVRVFVVGFTFRGQCTVRCFSGSQ